MAVRVGNQAVGGTYLPVSYTHLRAHETVLDLVCRLLLEKKKTTQQHYRTVMQHSKLQQNIVEIHALLHHREQQR